MEQHTIRLKTTYSTNLEHLNIQGQTRFSDKDINTISHQTEKMETYKANGVNGKGLSIKVVTHQTI